MKKQRIFTGKIKINCTTCSKLFWMSMQKWMDSKYLRKVEKFEPFYCSKECKKNANYSCELII